MNCNHVIQDVGSGGTIGEMAVVDTWLGRAKGLLFSQAMGDCQAVLLSPCSSVHTFFMRYAIDVVYLDKENTVIKVTRNLKPYRFDWCRGAKFVLEVTTLGAMGDRFFLGQKLMW